MGKSVEKIIQEAKSWPKEMAALRKILLKAGLTEEVKWNLPCFCHDESNIIILQPFKRCLGAMFFKGMLLKDPKKMLVANGPNSNSSRRFEFTSVGQIQKSEKTIQAYVKEAIALEKAGMKVTAAKKKSMAIPPELKKAFQKNEKFKAAFEGLTPGRQRAYLFFFSGAKQETTREARIEKWRSQILKGKGMNDRDMS